VRLGPVLSSALNGAEWSALRSSRYIPWETYPGIHLMEGWVGTVAVYFIQKTGF
jgi:hypothetical protein